MRYGLSSEIQEHSSEANSLNVPDEYSVALTLPFQDLLSEFPLQHALNVTMIVNEGNFEINVSKYKLGIQNQLFMDYFRTLKSQKQSIEGKETINIKCRKNQLIEIAFIIHYSHLDNLFLSLDEKISTQIFANRIETSVQHALEIAKNFQNKNLTRFCLDFLEKNLTHSNCLELLKVFRSGCDEPAFKLVEKYVLKYFGFLKPFFNQIDIEMFIYLLRSDRLNVRSEYKIVEYIFAWLSLQNFSHENYLSYMKHLLRSCLRLDCLDDHDKFQIELFMSSHNFLDFCENIGPLTVDFEDKWFNLFEEWILCSKKRCTIRSRTRSRTSDRNKKRRFTLLIADPLETKKFDHNLETFKGNLIAKKIRIPHEAIFIFGGCHEQKPSSTVSVLNTKTKEWIIYNDTNHLPLVLPKPLMSHAVSLVDQRYIYIAGGEHENYQITQEVICFDLKVRDGWKNCPLMNEKRRDHVLVHDHEKNRLYAIAGTNGKKVLDSVECLDLNLPLSWHEMPKLGATRGAACGTILGRKLYICGGYSDQSMEMITSSVEVLDLDRPSEWTNVKPMSQERYFAEAISHKGFLFVLGGGGTSTHEQRLEAHIDRVGSTVERYDPFNDSWELMPPMHERADFASCVHHGEVWCFGGGNESYYFQESQIWKPFVQKVPTSEDPLAHLGSWRIAIDLPIPLWGHRCANVSDIELIEPFLFPNVQYNDNSSNSNTIFEKAHQKSAAQIKNIRGQLIISLYNERPGKKTIKLFSNKLTF